MPIARLHPYKQQGQKSFSSDGPEHGNCGPGLKDNEGSFCSVAHIKVGLCARKIPGRELSVPFLHIPVEQAHFWQGKGTHKEGQVCVHDLLVGILETLKHGCLAFLRTPALLHTERFRTQNLKAEHQWVHGKFFLYINQSLQSESAGVASSRHQLQLTGEEKN